MSIESVHRGRAVTADKPGVAYQNLLAEDTRPLPDFLSEQSDRHFGTLDVPIDYYLSRDFHELEKERLWTRTWLMACREEVIPNVGDTEVFDIADLSFTVVRVTPTQVNAYQNACLHRGRQLIEGRQTIGEIRCQFHGFCWSLDGELKHVPASWDFPHVEAEQFRLPQVRVGIWGGFVWICLDPGAPDLIDYLGELPRQFRRWPLEDRYTETHATKVLPCNWKIAQEAFMESFHVITTHPQLLLGMGDAASQYDAYGWVSRALTPRGTPSPHLNYEVTEQEIFDSTLGLGIDDPPVMELPDDVTARTVVADATRRRLARVIGTQRADVLSDAECIDSFYYSVFPNLHPWGAYNRICYRFRPNGDDHETSIMEVMLLSPFQGERPAPADIQHLTLDQSWLEAEGLGPLNRVFFQDEYNIGWVQKGLRSLQRTKAGVTLGAYQETKIRHFYELYEQVLGL